MRADRLRVFSQAPSFPAFQRIFEVGGAVDWPRRAGLARTGSGSAIGAVAVWD